MYTVSAIRRGEYQKEQYIYSFIGKSSDSKPTHEDMATGSDLYDIDTKKVYMYDADEKTWIEQ